MALLAFPRPFLKNRLNGPFVLSGTFLKNRLNGPNYFIDITSSLAYQVHAQACENFIFLCSDFTRESILNSLVPIFTTFWGFRRYMHNRCMRQNARISFFFLNFPRKSIPNSLIPILTTFWCVGGYMHIRCMRQNARIFLYCFEKA